MPAVINMKIDKEVKEFIQKLAAEDNRTMANYIETILKRHVEEKKNEKVQ